MTGRRQVAEGDAPVVRGDLLGTRRVPVYRDCVIARRDRPRRAGRHLQAAGRRSAAHGEGRRGRVARGDAHRARVRAHGAVLRQPVELHGVTSRRQPAERHAVVDADGLLISVHRDRVAIGIEVRPRRAGRDGQAARRRGTAHREAGGDARAGQGHRLRVGAVDAAVRRDAAQLDSVDTEEHSAERRATVGRHGLALQQVQGSGVPVRIEVRTGRRRRDLNAPRQGGKQVGRRPWRGRVIAAQRPPDHNRYHVLEKRPTRAHDPSSTWGDRVRACAYLGPAAHSSFIERNRGGAWLRRGGWSSVDAAASQ